MRIEIVDKTPDKPKPKYLSFDEAMKKPGLYKGYYTDGLISLAPGHLLVIYGPGESTTVPVYVSAKWGNTTKTLHCIDGSEGGMKDRVYLPVENQCLVING